MARNRKRAKERRDRRPQTVGTRSSLSGNGGAADATPAPLEHATPDAELADAQLAVGRAEAEAGGGLADEAAFADGDAAQNGEAGYAPADAGGAPPAGPPAPPAGLGGGDGVALPTPGSVPEPSVRQRNRLIGFLEGSWRELQRVQWPDRRQVVQATAVVLGFVIVAGLVLAVADTLSSHLMSYIITGTHSVLAWVAVAVIVLSLAGWMLADRDK